VAARFAADGDDVVILGRRGAVLDRAASEINQACCDDRVTTQVADLTDPGQVAVAAHAIAGRGVMDVIVNNAGGAFGGSPTSLAETAEGWPPGFDGNVLTSVLLTEALEPALSRPGGRILTITSISALRGAGSLRCCEGGAARVDDEPRNLAGSRRHHRQRRCARLHPGHGVLELALTDEVVDARVALTPVVRPGTPEEVAAAVAYLASPSAGFTTGQILQVNGGSVLGRG
jgi:3-oxoacyl-[acyl-carrier protein] reductase